LHVYPPTKTVRVFQSPQQIVELKADETLAGGDVLPEITLALQDFFAEPGP